MPLYEYICTACGHEFELIQKFSDKPARSCPACNKARVKKKVSLAGFQLKGGGWYSDGYTKPGSAPSSPSKEKTSDKASDSKTETKPDKPPTPVKNTESKGKAA